MAFGIASSRPLGGSPPNKDWHNLYTLFIKLLKEMRLLKYIYDLCLQEFTGVAIMMNI